MDIQEAIAGLRVIRRYENRPLEPDHLTAILQAGRRASSSKNRQRWGFVAVTERDALRRLSAVGPFAAHVAGSAATIGLVTPRDGAEHPPSLWWDLGLATQNMILTAWSLGIGSCPITVYDEDVARDVLGYPDDRMCTFCLALGYPADPTDLTRPLKPGGRRPFDEVVHRERW